jgi:hypothetical protein
MLIRPWCLLLACSLVFALVFSCGESKQPPPPPKDPKRCEIKELGEAAEVIESGKVPSDQMVRVTGIGDPRSMVWQERTSGKAYFLSRVMGTQRRLFYLEELSPGESPRVLAVFEGHMTRWDQLPPKRAVPVANALSKEYKIIVEPTKTYLIINGEKPEGCP